MSAEPHSHPPHVLRKGDASREHQGEGHASTHAGAGHGLLMLLGCLVMLGAVFLLLGRTEGGLSTPLILLLLLCPLLHLFMHRGHRH